MNNHLWKRILPCLLAGMILLLCGGFALAEPATSDMTAEILNDGATVQRGEFLYVDVCEFVGATDYEVVVVDEDGEAAPDNRSYAFGIAPGEYTVQTATLPAGSYYVKVTAYVGEEVESESELLPFTVTEHAGDEEVVFRVSNTEPLAGEYVWVSVYAPYAQDVFLRRDNDFYVGGTNQAQAVLFYINKGTSMNLWAEVLTEDGSIEGTDVVHIEPVRYGSVGELEFDDDDTVRNMPGEDGSLRFDFTFTPNNNAAIDRAFLTLHDITDDEVVHRVEVSWSDLNAGYIEIPVEGVIPQGQSTTALQPGHGYELILNVGSAVPGYGDAMASTTFFVSEPVGFVQLTVNGQSDYVEVERNAEATLTIQSSLGQNGVRFFTGDRDENGNDIMEDPSDWRGEFDEDGSITFGWSYWEDRVIYAEVCVSEDPDAEDAQWVRSNSVLVHQVADHTLEAPVASLDFEIIQRGNFLTIHVDEWAEGAEWCGLDISNSTDGGPVDGYWFDHTPGVINLPTAQLEPGFYMVNLWNGAQNAYDGNTVMCFAVTEPDVVPEDGIWFTATGYTAQTGSPVSFAVVAEGAEWVDCWSHCVQTGADWYWEGGVSNLCFDWSWAHSGTYEIRVHVRYPGGEEIEKCLANIYVSADSGELVPAEIDVPVSLIAGNDLTFFFGAVENAEHYNMKVVSPLQQWNEVFFENYDEPPQSVTVPAECLDADNLYRVEVHAWADGYDASTAEAWVFVTGENDQVGEGITLSVGATTVENNTDVPVTVTLAEGLDPWCVELYDGDDNWDEFWGAWNGNALRPVGRSFNIGNRSEGDLLIVARAWIPTDEDNGYWLYSNSVTVHVTCNGSPMEGMEEPLVVLDSNEITAGEPLVVTLNEAPHGAEYHVRIQNIDDDNNYEYFFYYATPGQLYLPTGMLTEGDYRVTVNVRGESGWCWDGDEVRFHVSAPDEPVQGIYIEATNEEANRGEQIAIVAYAPGAIALRLYDHATNDVDEWWNESWGERLYGNPWMNDVGENTFWVRALYDENGEWSDPVSFIVMVSEDGCLPAPGLTLTPAVLTEGDSLTVTIENMADAQSYELRIEDRNSNMRDHCVYQLGNINAGEYTIPAGLFEAGHDYEVSVKGSRYGQRGDSARAMVVVKPVMSEEETLPAPTVTLIGLDWEAGESAGAYVNTDLRIIVEIPENIGATAVAWNDGRGWCYDALDQNQRVYRNTWSYDNETGIFTVIAKYTTDPLPVRDDGEIDWGVINENGWESLNLNWNGWSAGKSLSVYGGNDTLPQIVLSGIEDTQVGDYLAVSIDNIEAFEAYPDVWFRSYVEGWGGGYEWVAEDNCIYIPTVGQEPGTYTVWVDSFAPRVMGGSAHATFTVTDGGHEPGEACMVFSKDQELLLTEERLDICASVPGADSLEVYVYDEDAWNENDWRDHWSWGGDRANWWWNASRPGSYEFVLKASYPDGEPEPVEVLRETVVVNTLGGDFNLGPIDLSINPFFEPGSGIYFTVANDPDVDYYSVGIINDTEWQDNYWCDFKNTEDSWWYDISAEDFEMDRFGGLRDGCVYRIQVSAHRRGWNGSDAKASFYCGITEEDPELSLMIDGRTGDVVTVPNAEMKVELLFTGEMPDCFEWYNGNGRDWQNWFNRDDAQASMWNGRYVETRRDWGGSEDRIVRARAAYWVESPEDEYGSHWEYIYSNPIRLRFDPEGTIDTPEYELSTANPVRGEEIALFIQPVEQAEHVNHYDIHFWNDDGFWWSTWIAEAGNENGDFRLSTAKLEPGRYYVSVSAIGKTGWNNSDEIERVIEITDEGNVTPGQIYVTVSVPEIENGEDYREFQLPTGGNLRLTVYAPGANAIRVCDNNEDWSDCWPWDEVGDELYETDRRMANREELRLSFSALYEGAEDWSAPSDPIIVRFITPDGNLDDFDVYIRNTVLSEGDGAEVSVQRIENAESYEIRLKDTTSGFDYRWDNYCINFDADDVEWPYEFMVPPELLEAGHTYKLSFAADAYGYQRTYNEFFFALRNDAEVIADATLTFNERTYEGDNVEAATYINTNNIVRVVAPANATAVTVYDGVNGWYCSAGNTAEYEWNWGNGGYTLLYARYATGELPRDENGDIDWVNVNWTGASNTIVLNLVQFDDAPDPQATLVSGTVARGDMVAVNIGNAQELAIFTVDAAPYYEPDDQWFGRWYEWDGQNIYVPTADLEAGRTYKLYVRAYRPGFTERQADLEFTVVDPDETREIIFNVSAASVQTNEDVSYSVYAPGANAIIINNYGSEWRRYDGTDFVSDCSSWPDRQEMNLWVMAHYGDEWENEEFEPVGWVMSNETHPLTITAPEGRMPLDAQVNVSGAESGGPLVINWSYEGDYDHIDVNVHRVCDGWHMWGRRIDNGAHSGVLRVPVYGDPNRGEEEVILEPGETYDIHFNIHRKGWQSTGLSTTVTILASGSVEEGFTLTANGQTSSLTVQTNENIAVAVNAPQNATGICLYAFDGSPAIYYRGRMLETALSNSHISGFQIYARYTTDEMPEDPDAYIDWDNVNWSETTSNVVQVNVTASSYVSMDFTAPDSVTRGDRLVVHLNNYMEHTGFRAQIYEPGNDWRYLVQSDDWDYETKTITLNTASLPAGLYRLEVGCGTDMVGYEGCSGSKFFEVTEPEEDMILVLEEDRTTFATQEGSNIVAYARGAVHMRLEVANTDDLQNPFWTNDVDGDTIDCWSNFGGHEGAKVLTAIATYSDGTTKTRSIGITVTADCDLPEPVITAPEVVPFNEDLVFSVSAEHADWWFAELYDETADCWMWHEDVHPNEDREFTIPASEFSVGHDYHIHVYAAAYNWNDINVNFNFTVSDTGDPYDGSVLYLPASLREIEEEAFAGTLARTVVIPSGATTIGTCAFQGCGNLQYVVIPDSVVSIDPDAFADCGRLIFICSEESSAAVFARGHGYGIRAAE